MADSTDNNIYVSQAGAHTTLFNNEPVLLLSDDESSSTGEMRVSLSSDTDIADFAVRIVYYPVVADDVEQSITVEYNRYTENGIVTTTLYPIITDGNGGEKYAEFRLIGMTAADAETIADDVSQRIENAAVSQIYIKRIEITRL